MLGWHHQLNGHEFEQILGDSEGQGSQPMGCCSPWGNKESDTTERLNNNHHPHSPPISFRPTHWAEFIESQPLGMQMTSVDKVTSRVHLCLKFIPAGPCKKYGQSGEDHGPAVKELVICMAGAEPQSLTASLCPSYPSFPGPALHLLPTPPWPLLTHKHLPLSFILRGKSLAFYWVLFQISWVASLVAQTVKNPPARRETWVWSLGWEDLLEEEMATHSSIPAWRIPMDRGAWGLSPWGSKDSNTTERLSFSLSLTY